MASNVTRLPARNNDAPRDILKFEDGYLEAVYYGNRWRHLADLLGTWLHNIPESMHPFICRMQKRKQRPTADEIAAMVGLLIRALTLDKFEAWESRDDGAEIIQLRK